ncbi:MAG: AraC family transcriptional regulator [Lachnospiraceae bacterium]|nr:AraC family transcriptional regulator [Lachnospiraceae bacterium]
MLNVRFLYEGRDYSIEIRRIAREHCLPQKQHEIKINEEQYSFHLIQHGYGTLIYNGKSVSLSKGSAFLISPNDGEYEYFPDQLTPWTYFWIDLSGEGLDDMFHACGFTKDKPYLFLGNDIEPIIKIFKLLVDGYGGGETQSLLCAGYVIVLFGELIKRAQKFHSMRVRDMARFKVFRDILIFIDNNYRLSFTLEDICEMMNITKTQLFSMFNDYADMTPVSYINRYRISLACIMLRETELDIKSIASLIGFDDVKYFARVFTKWKGMSPRDYRKNGEDDDPYQWLIEKDIDFR